MPHSMYPSIVRMRKDMFSVPCPACIHMDTNAGLDRTRRHTQGMLREKVEARAARLDDQREEGLPPERRSKQTRV